MVLELDTSGEVALSVARGIPFEVAGGHSWFDLNPFTRGYVTAMLVQLNLSRGYMPGDGQAGARELGFSDLAPETLSLIIDDCAAMRSGLLISGAPGGGREAWTQRQSGWVDWGTKPRADWPPLTVYLGDDGKVYLK